MNENTAAAQRNDFTSFYLQEATPTLSPLPAPDRRVEQVLAALRENLQSDFAWETFTWEKFARQFGLSLRHLERLFKAAKQPTLSQCLHALRLERACELLEDPSLSAQEIAAKVGFKHETYFSRAFKRAKGLPPITYRKQCEREKQTEKRSDVAGVQEMSP